ncbi:MAG: 3'-5' exonuclease [DPANN group archaeon]|nr:3'-5' exonuclease [DPANN group archaeon]
MLNTILELLFCKRGGFFRLERDTLLIALCTLCFNGMNLGLFIQSTYPLDKYTLASTKVHGITNEKAHEVGIPLQNALSEFVTSLNNSSLLVAHKMSFDEKVVGSELIRMNIENNLSSINKICTMKNTTDFCQIPGPYGYKWPTLMELHQKLFNNTFDNAHDALSDVSACAKCFFELKNRGIIKHK